MDASTDPALAASRIARRPTDTDVALRMYGTRPPFVGRQASLRTLYEAAREATQTGRLRQVTLTGDKGIGKTRLCHELIDLIEAGGHPITALRAVASEGLTSGYGLVDQLVRRRFHIEPGASDDIVMQRLRRGLTGAAPAAQQERWVHLLGSLVGLPVTATDEGGPETVRLHALAAFGTLLATEAQSRPLILILDALQWVDEEGLQTLDQLVAQLVECPAVTVYAARTETLSPQPLGDGAVTPIRLGPLPDDGAMHVAAGLLGGQSPEELHALEDIVAASGGNPGAVARSIRELLTRGAVTLEGRTLTINLRELEAEDLVLEGRDAPREGMEGRSQAEREVLLAAAVFGERFWFDGVLALLWASRSAQERDPTDADRIEMGLHHTLLGLLRRDVVRLVASAGADGDVVSRVVGTDELAFAHAEDRRHVLEQADADQLLILRGWAGRWMLAAHPQDPQRWLIQTGHVLDESDRGDLAIEAWCRASEAALHQRRDDIVVAACEHVLATTEDDDEQRTRALGGLADVGERQGRFAEALDAWNELLRWARVLGDRRLAARANVAQGRLLERLGRGVEAREVLACAASRCEELGMGDDRASTEEVLARLAGAEGTAAAHGEALAHLRHALALWRGLGRDLAVGRVQLSCSTHLAALGSLGEARATAAHARRSYASRGDRTGEARALDLLAAAAAISGAIDEAAELWAQALRCLDDAGAPYVEATVLANVSDAHLLRGDLDRARHTADAALALALQLRNARLEARARHRRAAVLRHEGELDAAREEAQGAHRLAQESGDLRLAAATLRGLADVEARALARRIARAEALGTNGIQAVGKRLRDACRHSEAVGDRGGLAHALEAYADYLDAVGAGHKCRKVRLRAEGLRAQLRADWEAGGQAGGRAPEPRRLRLPSMDELEQVARRAARRHFGEPFHG